MRTIGKFVTWVVGLAMLAGNAWAVTKGVKGIDIIVKKQPTGPAITVTSDGAGRVRFNLAEAGTYTISGSTGADTFNCPAGSVRIGNECFVLNGVKFTGRFNPAASAPAGAQVTAKYVDGNALFAAGSANADGTLFSVDITVPSAFSFAGTIAVDDGVGIRTRHLTFYELVNGPQPPAQSLVISNGSTSALSYTATFAPVGAAQWTASLSKSSGTIPAGLTDSIDVGAPAGLPEGGYNGFLHVQFQSAAGSYEQVAAVTLVVQQPEASKAGVLSGPPMAAAYPLPSGGYESPSFQLTNNGPSPRTIAPRADEGLTLTPTSLTLAPGQTGTIVATLDQAKVPSGGWGKVCYQYDPLGQGASTTMITCVWRWNGVPSGALVAACTPTSLQPVITGMNPPVARLGHPLDVTVQVYDNCGNPHSDFTATLSVNNGGTGTALESHIAAVQAANGTAISKSGTNGFIAKIGPEAASTLAAVADSTPELTLNGQLYPYFRDTRRGLTLRVDAEAPNTAGSDSLTGSVDLPLAFDSDPAAPLMAPGAFVGNTTFEAVPMAPYELFSLFTVVPGLTPVAGDSVPFPSSLGGVQVLIDGTANVPLLGASNGQISGILPDLATGRHIVNVLYNNVMSGAIELDVADANPSPLHIDAATPHLYDASGVLITQQNPIRPGQIYAFYANGLGRMKGINQIAGAPTPGVAMEPEQACNLTIGGNKPVIVYCGRSPGAVALDQVNFRLDQIDAPGAHPGDIVPLSIELDQGEQQGSNSALGWLQVGPAGPLTLDGRFDTNPGGLQYTVNGISHAGAYGPAPFPNNQAIAVDVPNPTQAAGPGVQYKFVTWTAPPVTANTAKGSFSPTFFVTSLKIGQPPPPPPVMIATFQTQYLLTLVGASANPSSTGGYYDAGSKVTVTGQCPVAGQVLGLLVQIGSNDSASFPSPSVIVMSAPTVVTVQCAPLPPLNTCFALPSNLSSALIGWWPLDEATGTVAKNIGTLLATGDGTYTGNPPYVFPGKVAGAHDFSSGGSVVVNTPTAYDWPASPTRALTIDAWIQGTGLKSGTNHIVGKHDDGTKGGYFLSIVNGQLSLHLHDVKGRKRDFTEPPAEALKFPVYDGAWHHVAATVDFANKAGVLYVNGIQVLLFTADYYGTAFDDIVTPPALKIGWNSFPGFIDEVEIFSRALTVTDIQNTGVRADRFGKCKGPYTVTSQGCGVLISNPAYPPGTTTFPAGTVLSISAKPGTGGLVSVTVTMNGVTTTYTSVPFNIPLTSDATIVAQCPDTPGSCLANPLGRFPSMVGWYALDETNPSTTSFADWASSPASLALNSVSGFAVVPMPAKVQGGWEFSGTTSLPSYLGSNYQGSYLSSSAAKYNFGTGNFSIDAWVSLFPNDSTPLIWKMTSGANPAGFNLALDKNYVRLDLGDGTTQGSWVGTLWPVGNTTPGAHALHHVLVAVTRGSNPKVEIYVDGKIETLKQTGSMPALSISNTAALKIGGNRRLLLDEIELFNTALTGNDAQVLYLEGPLGKCRQQTTNTVTWAGCGLTVAPLGGAPLTVNPATLPANTLLLITANPGQGNMLHGIKVTINGVTTTYTSSPITISLTGNAVVTADCGCIVPPQQSTLVTWYSLDEKTSPWADLGSQPTNATVTQGSPTYLATAKVGGALSFPGTAASSWIEAANGSEGDIRKGNFSIDLWIRTTASSGTQTFLDKRVNRNAPLTKGYAFYLIDGRLGFQMATGDGDPTNGICGTAFSPTASCTNFEASSASPNVADGNWHLVAVTVNRNSTTGGNLWVDGQPVRMFDPTGHSATMSVPTPLRIGNWGNATASVNGFTGDLDEIEIFYSDPVPPPASPGVLSQADILAIYAADSSGKCKTAPCLPPTGYAAYYTLDSATTITDTSGHGLDGTIVTPAWINTPDPYGTGGTLIQVPGQVGNGVRFPRSVGPGTFNGQAYPPNPEYDTVAVKLPPVANLDPSRNDIALTTYVKFDSTSVGYPQVIWGRAWLVTGDDDGSYNFSIDSSNFSLGRPGLAIVQGATNLSSNGASSLRVPFDGQWHCVGFSFHHRSDGYGEVTFTVDGNVDGPFIYTNQALKPLPTLYPNAVPRMYIGWAGFDSSTQDLRFSGSLDELKLFDRQLTASEMHALCGCANSSTFPISVDTNPANIGATVGLTAPATAIGTATDLYVYSIGAPDNYVATVTPTTITSGTTQYRFNNTWSLNGPVDSSLGGTATTLSKSVSAAATFTANFDTYYQVTIDGNCSSQNTAGIPPGGGSAFVKAGSAFNASFAGLSGATVQSLTVNGVLQTGTVVNVNPVTGPLAIIAKCGTNIVSHTVTTNPASLRVTIDGGPQLTAPQTVQWTPGSSHNLGAPSPQLNGAGDTQYSLKTVNPWTATVGTITSTGAVASAPSSSSTYTANFDAAYKVLLNLTGCSNQNNANIPAGGGSTFLPAGSTFNTNVVALTPFQLWGGTVNGVDQIPTFNGPVNAPLTIAAECGKVNAAYRANGDVLIDIVLTSVAGSATAKNIRVTNISNISPTNITLVNTALLGQVWGNLASGQAASRNAQFSQSASGIPFSFTLTYAADNMPPQQVVINVPFPR